MLFDDILQNVRNMIKEYELITKEEIEELTKSIIVTSKQYINDNIINIIYPEFNKHLTKYIYDIHIIQIIHLYDDNIKYRIKFKLLQLINRIQNELYREVMPPRSYKSSFVRNIIQNNKYKNRIREKITILQNIIQPAQRSEEWYSFRHNLLTASSIWKVFGSQATQNNIIYEKCKPHATFGQSPLNSPLHWGQKYEPVSVEFYKKMYNTEVEDFGCIKHNKYPYIGASPDGIITDINNERYGRMLEIKNIVNREINGIPKMEYWIQMQLQMETCNLNECDFLETKFTEYESEEKFLKDGTYTYSSDDDKLKGILILFNSNGTFYYEYAPLYITESEFIIWEKDILEKNHDKEWIQNIFWKLEKYSNILVLRNKLWFKTTQPFIENLWKTIENERVNGYEHRAPNRKKRTTNNNNLPENLLVNKCFITIEKEDIN
jgi:putative phage-type endonuclease